MAAITFLKDELSLEDLAESILYWTDQVQIRLNAALENGEWLPVDAKVPTDDLATLKTEFQDRIDQLIEMDDAEARARLQHEKKSWMSVSSWPTTKMMMLRM